MPASHSPLSRREREVMDILYRTGEATVAEVMDAMQEPPTYSAVRSILRVLEEKEHIVHREDGPRYVYAPAVERDRARRADLALPETQIRRLAKAIEKAREEGR